MSALLKRLFSGLVFDNIFIALCAVALVQVSRKVLHQAYAITAVDSFVFFSTLLVYNLHKSLSLLPRQSPFAVLNLILSSQLSRPFRALIYSGILGTAASFILLDALQQILVTGLALVTFAYSFPVLKIKNTRKRIRELFIIKVLVISLVWSIVTAGLPAVHERFSSIPFFLLFTERLLFIFAITIPFEIRDMEQEKKWGNKTLPVVLGAQKSKHLAYLLLALFSVLVLAHFLLVCRPAEPSLAAAMILSAGAAGLLIYLTEMQRSSFFFKFFVDGTMMLQFIFVILFS